MKQDNLHTVSKAGKFKIRILPYVRLLSKNVTSEIIHNYENMDLSFSVSLGRDYGIHIGGLACVSC